MIINAIFLIVLLLLFGAAMASMLVPFIHGERYNRENDIIFKLDIASFISVGGIVLVSIIFIVKTMISES